MACICGLRLEDCKFKISPDYKKITVIKDIINLKIKNYISILNAEWC